TRRHRGVFSITSQRARVSNTISRLERRYFVSDFRNDACRFLSIDERQWRWITTFTKVNVDEVDARGFDLNERFVWFWRRNRQVNRGQHLRPAGFRNLYGLHGHRLARIIFL